MSDAPIEHVASSVRPIPWRRAWLALRPFAGIALAAAVLALLWRDYQASQVPFTIVYDGHRYDTATHQTTVAGALAEAGIQLSPYDLVEPAPDAPLPSHGRVTVRPATRVIVETDSHSVEHFTHERTAAGILGELGISFSPHDALLVGGREVSPEEPLPGFDAAAPSESRSFGRPVAPWERLAPPPLRLTLKRAVALNVDDGGIPSTIHTTAATVGEALRANDVIVYLGDRVSPDLDSHVSPGLKVYIQRSRAIELTADGHSLHTRTRGETVADVLAQQRIALVGDDLVEPPESTSIEDSVSIRVKRMSRATVVEQETISFETAWRPASDIEIDHQQVEQEGLEGVSKRRIHVVYQDGQETERSQEDEWLENEPQKRIIAYGTKIVPRQLVTPDGNVTYWRKVRMLATSYSAATAGKSADHPRYGITFTGVPVSKGIVAVDPKVVGLQSQLFVPGYGFARAADTGGGIKGRRIDLGFGDDDLEMWYRWVDVYVLGEPPPDDEIRWVLPNWPLEGR